MISVLPGTGKVPSLKDSEVSALTPGQTSLIESNSFTSDKFVSKRSSKKWDVPPSGVAQKKTVSAAKKFDVTAVDPSEFVPKVVPMCEVESALGREEGGGGGGDEEGGKGVVSIRQETASETEVAIYVQVLCRSEICLIFCIVYSLLTGIRSGCKNSRR